MGMQRQLEPGPDLEALQRSVEDLERQIQRLRTPDPEN
jgi:hypothetical protein